MSGETRTAALLGTSESFESAARAVGREAALLAGLLVWVGFWSVVVRLHYLQGDFGDLIVTATAFVLAPVGAYGWRLARALSG